MKVSSSVSPLAFTLETNPRRPNFRLTRFHENAIETESGWEYDEYCLEFPTSDTLEVEIKAHYWEYLKQAMEAEGASAAEYISVARAAALERISGKCSAAIYAGVDVSGKHYRMTENDQLSLNAAIVLATSTGESISYAADGEAGTKMTAAQLSAIGKAGYDWGFVCRSYYGLLYSWVQRETDTDKLAAIHFGSTLPDDLMQQLTSKLTGAGIDITKYAAALTGG